MGEMENVFEGLNDPRRVSGQHHSLHDILVIALCTLLCGGETCTDMALFGRAKREFLERFLKLENGIPSHDTPAFAGAGSSPECSGCWTRRRSTPGFWASWNSSPKVAKEWWP